MRRLLLLLVAAALIPACGSSSSSGAAPPAPISDATVGSIVHDLYKLILSTVRTPELYDLTADPGEVNNLWATQQNTVRVTQMKLYFQKWITRTGDTLAPTLILQMP